MKTMVCLLGGMMLAAAGAASASEILTVEMQARVTDVYDPAGALQNQVTVGQTVQGSYSYDTTVQDEDSSYQYGSYPQVQGGISVTAGSLTFQVQPQFEYYNVMVHPSDWPGYYQGSFRLNARGGNSLPSGANVSSIMIDFSDMHSGAPFSDALPGAAPDLNNYEDRSIMIDGQLNGTWFSVILRIESAQVKYTGSPLVISPGESTFVRDQRFDAALILPPGSQPVQQVRARVGNDYLPLSFPGNCNLSPPNSQARTAIICRDAQWALPPQNGPVHVEWEVELMGGEVLRNAVDWHLIP